jgi:hypothetical protein
MRSIPQNRFDQRQAGIHKKLARIVKLTSVSTNIMQFHKNQADPFEQVWECFNQVIFRSLNINF